MNRLPVIDACESAADVRMAASAVITRRKKALRSRPARRAPELPSRASLPDVSQHAPVVKERPILEYRQEPPIDIPNFLAARNEARFISIRAVMNAVAHYFNISIRDLMSDRRHYAVTHPRQIGMYLARRLTKLSMPHIGKYFGNRDHTTVLHGFRKIQAKMTYDEATRRAVTEIEHTLLTFIATPPGDES